MCLNNYTNDFKDYVDCNFRLYLGRLTGAFQTLREMIVYLGL